MWDYGKIKPEEIPSIIESKDRKNAGKTLYGATVSKNESNITYTPGQRVSHKTFGEGMIISAKPMGGDTMLEVAFDNVGTKKLMAAYAKLTVM